MTLTFAALSACALCAAGAACNGAVSCNWSTEEQPDGSCTTTWTSCSDGSAYQVACAGVDSGSECSCRKDLVETGVVFTISGAACAEAKQANIGCGWDLEE